MNMTMSTMRQAYIMAKENGWSQELEDIIIDSGNPFWACEFARDVEGANISRLEQVVIDSGNPMWAYYFALYVPGANISDLIGFVLINDPKRIKQLFKDRPDLKRKYELGEIRKQIRRILK